MSLKINRIELNKQEGMTLQVVNGESVQSIKLDGDKITFEVTNGGSTSKIVQTPDGVTIDCNNFKVNATMAAEMTLKPLGSPIATGTLALSLTGATVEGAMVNIGVPLSIPAGIVSIDAPMAVAITSKASVTLGAPEITIAGAPLFIPFVP
jgi:hypothetical protein